jgi:hypothetical protein
MPARLGRALPHLHIEGRPEIHLPAPLAPREPQPVGATAG